MRRIIFLIMFLTPLCFADYSSHDDVKSFIKEMHQKHDFDQNYLISIFSNANKQQKIIDLMNRPAEKTFSWDKYRKRLVSPMRIENGQKFFNFEIQIQSDDSIKIGYENEDQKSFKIGKKLVEIQEFSTILQANFDKVPILNCVS